MTCCFWRINIRQSHLTEYVFPTFLSTQDFGIFIKNVFKSYAVSTLNKFTDYSLLWQLISRCRLILYHENQLYTHLTSIRPLPPKSSAFIHPLPRKYCQLRPIVFGHTNPPENDALIPPQKYNCTENLRFVECMIEGKPCLLTAIWKRFLKEPMYQYRPTAHRASRPILQQIF